jgi:hypothetical protein
VKAALILDFRSARPTSACGSGRILSVRTLCRGPVRAKPCRSGLNDNGWGSPRADLVVLAAMLFAG